MAPPLEPSRHTRAKCLLVVVVVDVVMMVVMMHDVYCDVAYDNNDADNYDGDGDDVVDDDGGVF